MEIAKEMKFENNLNCYGTKWEYEGQTYGSTIFAKTPEEAEKMIKAKRENETLNGQVIAKYCLNPDEITKESLENYKEFLKE